MSRRRSLRIGITIGLRTPDESLWINGIKQNALFLAKLLRHSPLGHEVRLLNTTDVAITDALPWDRRDFDTRPIDGGYDDLDVVIELGGQVSAEQTRRMRSRGTRLISYCCGPEYVQMIEAMIFRRHMTGPSIFINPDYDAIWMIPQIAGTTRGYLESFRRRRARVVPFVWDPMALTSAYDGQADAGVYTPRPGAKSITVIEPNIDVMKFCLYPTLIAEDAYRQAPKDIAFVHVTNARHLVADNREFVGLMSHLDLVRDHRISFIDRVDTPIFLRDNTDIVVSHQWGLPLNYFYLECCWLGYPLIHNAHLIDDCGYYYPDNDIRQGGDRLVAALREHDADHVGYRSRQRERLHRFLASNVALAEEYDELLMDVVHGIEPAP